jgi:hypothetical protein
MLKGAELLLSGVTYVNDMFCHTNKGSLASLGAVDGLEAMGLGGGGRLQRRGRRRPAAGGVGAGRAPRPAALVEASRPLATDLITWAGPCGFSRPPGGRPAAPLPPAVPGGNVSREAPRRR